jgi:hypothetical protein
LLWLLLFVWYLLAVHEGLDNESWVIHVGAEVIEKRAANGDATLSQVEQLIYLLWWVDYGMRNAGDLLFAGDEYTEKLRQGSQIAERLELSMTAELFGMTRERFESEYFNRFDEVLKEIRALLAAST